VNFCLEGFVGFVFVALYGHHVCLADVVMAMITWKCGSEPHDIYVLQWSTEIWKI